jgi:hypothetical protein
MSEMRTVTEGIAASDEDGLRARDLGVTSPYPIIVKLTYEKYNNREKAVFEFDWNLHGPGAVVGMSLEKTCLV